MELSTADAMRARKRLAYHQGGRCNPRIVSSRRLLRVAAGEVAVHSYATAARSLTPASASRRDGKRPLSHGRGNSARVILIPARVSLSDDHAEDIVEHAVISEESVSLSVESLSIFEDRVSIIEENVSLSLHVVSLTDEHLSLR